MFLGVKNCFRTVVNYLRSHLVVYFRIVCVCVYLKVNLCQYPPVVVGVSTTTVLKEIFLWFDTACLSISLCECVSVRLWPSGWQQSFGTSSRCMCPNGMWEGPELAFLISLANTVTSSLFLSQAKQLLEIILQKWNVLEAPCFYWCAL